MNKKKKKSPKIEDITKTDRRYKHTVLNTAEDISKDLKKEVKKTNKTLKKHLK